MIPRNRLVVAVRWGALSLALGAVASAEPSPKMTASASSALRFTARTPDEMLDLALARARSGGDTALAGLAVAYALVDRAAAGRAQSELQKFGEDRGELGQQARWLAAAVKPDGAAPPGLITGWSLLGPFQDSGGGLTRREGPEQPGQRWGDHNASYAWGAYEVRWRPVPREVTSARGVPLDLMVQPRKESCSYLATRVTLRDAEPLVLQVASSGSVRLIWDGADAGIDEEDHEGLVFDRLAAQIEAAPGAHLLAVKVCSGAPTDDGRVRVRASTPEGQPLDLITSPAFDAPTPFSTAKPAITAVATAWSRSVTLDKNATDDRALGAAIVRTLGRADDLRSPRAPGLLDRVVNRKGTPPDRLAMAGWVAPFGADRSGWLNQAVARALSAGDLATASFAQRRLIVARLSSRWTDWALASLGAQPFASDEDAEARLIRAMVRGGSGLDSLRRVALSDLLEAVTNEGPRASSALWEQIASLSGTLDPLVHARAKNELTKLQPEARDPSWVSAMTPYGKSAVRAASNEALASGALTSARDLTELADALIGAGLREQAQILYETGIQLAPNDPAQWTGAAEGWFARGERTRAEQALARARALDPADVRYRAELGFRSAERHRVARAAAGERGSEEPSSEASDSVYMVEPAVFLARKQRTPLRQGEVFDRQLHWLRAVTFHADRRVSQLIQYAREIVIEPRTQDELYEVLPSESDDTEIVRARVHRAAGGVAFAEEEKSDRGRATIRWPDLKKGDVVEVVIRSWTHSPVGRRGDPPFYFVDYAGAVSTHPLLFNQVVVDSPEDRSLAVDVMHGKPDRTTDEVKSGRHVVNMIWDNPPNIPDEPLAPKSSEVLPTIVGSTFATWKDFREWYQAAVYGFTEPDEQVRRLAADLTRGKTTREDKVKALFEFVADDIRYVNYVSGEWWLPNRPQQLLARRQGDCDDKAILLITLLRAVGIDATEVLVQTRYTDEPSLLLSQRAAIPLFDHGIAYLPGPAGSPGQWLDATSPESRLGPLPSMDARALALFVAQGEANMVRTPVGSPAEHGVEGTWKITLTSSGAGDLDATERHSGDHAFLLRTSLREKDARAQWVEQNLLSGWFPTVEVGQEVEFASDLPEGAARVHYTAHSEGLARREGGELVLPLSPSSTMTSRLAPLVKRTLPVVLPPSMAPSHQSRTIEIVPPAGFHPEQLARGGEENGGPFGYARVEIQADPARPTAVQVKRTVVFDMSTIPVQQYGAWRAWLQRVDALLHRSVRFAPVDAAHRAVKSGAPS